MSVLVFDIETFPKLEDGNLQKMLDFKVSKMTGLSQEEKEQKKLSYFFHEPQFSNVICISFILSMDGESIDVKDTLFSREDEKTLVSDFISIISDFESTHKGGIYVTYNGIDFDVPYLLYKCVQHEIIPPQRFCNLMRFRNNPHYDVMQVLSNWGKFRISLKEMCYSFGVTNPKILREEDESTLDFMLRASDEDIIKYNEQDVLSLFDIYKKVSKIFQ